VPFHIEVSRVYTEATPVIAIAWFIRVGVEVVIEALSIIVAIWRPIIYSLFHGCRDSQTQTQFTYSRFAVRL